MKTRAGSARHTTEGGMDPSVGIRSATRHSDEEMHEHYRAPDCGKEMQADEKFCNECGTDSE